MKTHAGSIASVLLCALTFGCGGERSDRAPWSEEEFLPPGGEYVGAGSGFRNELSITDEVAPDDAFEGWVSRLRNGVPAWTFGDEDPADPDRVIGALTDVAVLEQEVVLLDEQASRLVFVDTESGTVRRTYGRSGAGPDEFQNPVSVAAASFPSVGRLLVVDEFFRLRALDASGDSVTVTFAARQDHFLRGACFTRDRLVLHLSPQRDANIITYRIDPGQGLDDALDLGAPELQVRPLYFHPHPATSGMLDQSVVACGGRTVAFGNALLPSIRVAYFDEGADWEIRFNGLVLPKVRIGDDHSVRISRDHAPGGVTHVLGNARYLSNSLLVVQFRGRESGSANAEGKLQIDWESFLLDTSTKAAAYVGRLDGKVLGYDPAGDRVIWGRDVPFPRVTATDPG